MPLLNSDAILREEANTIHSGKALPDGSIAGDIPAATSGLELYKELHKRNSAALCLSGGGIRSASFALGLIEALAVHPRPLPEHQADNAGDSLLSKFHYLSTVSGGGYIGSWLSAWISRHEYPNVWRRLVGRRDRPDEEPSEIVWLRSYSNYLTPQVGLFSADTWAAVSLYVRNLTLNWLVILPALCLALLAIKVAAILTFWFSALREPIGHWFAGLFILDLPPDLVPWPLRDPVTALYALGGVALMVYALRFTLLNRPSRDPCTIHEEGLAGAPAAQSKDAHRNERTRVRSGTDQTTFVKHCLVPALLAALVWSLYFAVRGPKLADWSLGKAALISSIAGVGIYTLGWLFARPWLNWVPCPNEDRSARTSGYWFKDFLAWISAGAVYGAMIGLGIRIVAKYQPFLMILNVDVDHTTSVFLLSFVYGIPWIVTAQLTAEMIFVGLTSWQPYSDSDREWFGRSTGWFAISAFAWLAATFLALIVGEALLDLISQYDSAKYGSALLAAGSAVFTTLWGGGGKTPANDQRARGSFLQTYALPLGAIVVLLALVLAVSVAMDHLMFDRGLIYSSLLTIPSMLETVNRGLAALHEDLISYWLDGAWLVVGVVVVGGVAAVAWKAVNINRFSLHSLYRNRLIRGYLGASNPERAPNPFTGFDEGDNIRMWTMWPRQVPAPNKPLVASPPPKPPGSVALAAVVVPTKQSAETEPGQAPEGGEPEIPQVEPAPPQGPPGPEDTPAPTPQQQPWRPFHVVNMALNVVNSKRLAWQERKAESFTATPLHCGSAGPGLGYRDTKEYSDKEDEGMTLGTALAISGAAASPNMGYNSSPLVTLLLALLNVRLGWWLGNPGHAGNNSYGNEGPSNAIMPFLREMFGWTTDDSEYVYLSDGGHFENLALYEMIRRRCRCIVVSDGGCDPSFGFEDLGNAVRKIAIDLGVYINFGKLRALKARSKDNSVIEGAYYAIGEIDYKTAPEGTPASENGLILYIKPTYHGTESAGIVAYATANAAFPHETTADQFFSESQFESYRTLGFEIMDGVLTEALKAHDNGWSKRTPKRPGETPYAVPGICELIKALAPPAVDEPQHTGVAEALKRLDEKDLKEMKAVLAKA